jgi:hypothetical protein
MHWGLSSFEGCCWLPEVLLLLLQVRVWLLVLLLLQGVPAGLCL